MELEEFKKFFEEQLSQNNINIEIEMEEFYIYMKNILEWNEKINVTNIKEEKEFIIKHFIDSLTISKYIENNSRVLDIGTGGGFPGIPLKLSNKTIKGTLIDSVNKKIIVVNDGIEKLKLEKIEAIHTRAEDLAIRKDYREGFDIVVTRAVSNLSTIVEYMLPFLKIGGKAICMKGPNYEEELEEAKKAINVLGGTLQEINKIKISEEFERNIIIIKKEKITPKQYPRGNGKPLRNPIK